VAAVLERVLQGLGPGTATFAVVCHGVEKATGLEYMPAGLVSAPFKRAVKDALCALFASKTGNGPPSAAVTMPAPILTRPIVPCLIDLLLLWHHTKQCCYYACCGLKHEAQRCQRPACRKVAVHQPML
jgi:hypothetical protein